MSNNGSGMVDPAIFDYLQSKIDEDTQVRDQVKVILQDLEKQGTEDDSELFHIQDLTRQVDILKHH